MYDTLCARYACRPRRINGWSSTAATITAHEPSGEPQRPQLFIVADPGSCWWEHSIREGPATSRATAAPTSPHCRTVERSPLRTAGQCGIGLRQSRLRTVLDGLTDEERCRAAADAKEEREGHGVTSAVLRARGGPG